MYMRQAVFADQGAAAPQGCKYRLAKREPKGRGDPEGGTPIELLDIKDINK
jgi:hypothetical protein